MDQDKFRNAVSDFSLGAKISGFAGVLALGLLTAAWLLLANCGGATRLLTTIPFAVAALFAVAAWIDAILAGQAAQEDEEKALLAQKASTRALNVDEDVRFTAGRTSRNFHRFSPYVIALLGAMLIGAFLIYAKAQSRIPEAVMLRGNFIHSALIEAVMLALAVFTGIFLIGQSRVAFCRWLRPAGAWLCVGFAALAADIAVDLGATKGWLGIDLVTGRILFWLLAVLAAEMVVNFIIEFYRPRNAREQRPVFESRLLALVTEPGGMMRNIAAALDYQFGFQISGTWLYAFIERAFFPVLAVFFLLFWGATAIHEIGPNQVGVRQSFGKLEGELLRPGIYFSLPAPFGRVHRFSCTELQQVVIGESNEVDGQVRSVVTWTEVHGQSADNFVVSVPAEPGVPAGNSISFIRMQIPVQYRIKPDGVLDYAYNHRQAPQLLQLLGYQTLTSYLASCSMEEIMSSGRAQAEAALKADLQQRADRAELGVEIVSLSILDAHPPTGGEKDVAASYQDVIGALEKKEPAILTADAYAAKTAPEAAAEVAARLADANAYAHRVKIVAAAESARFAAQSATYRAMPQMFKLNAYLDALEKDAAERRKFIVSRSVRNEVYELNFEEKSRLDLLNSSLGSMTASEK